MKRFVTIFLLLAFCGGVMAQKPDMCIKKRCGEVVKDGFTGYGNDGFVLTSVWVESEDGKKVKIKAEDLEEFSYNVDKSAYGLMVISALGINPYSEELSKRILEGERVVYELTERGNVSVLNNVKSFNEIFGEYIQVKDIPELNSDKGYVLLKDDKELKVSKKNYKEMSSELYGDCLEFQELFSSDKYRFRDLPKHVRAYNLLKRL